MAPNLPLLSTQLLDHLKGLKSFTAACRAATVPGSVPIIKIDLYFDGQVPRAEERQKALGRNDFFEMSLDQPKDRFFWQEIPVTLEYKVTQAVEDHIAALFAAPFQLYQNTTYSFHRLFHGIVLDDSQGWLATQRQRLTTLPEDFWLFHEKNLNQRLEHNISDIGAGVFAQDELHFLVALGRFLETAAERVFAARRRFLCPLEDVRGELEHLEGLPSGWSGLWSSLIRMDGGVDPSRKVEIARHLAGALLQL